MLYLFANHQAYENLDNISYFYYMGFLKVGLKMNQ